MILNVWSRAKRERGKKNQEDRNTNYGSITVSYVKSKRVDLFIRCTCKEKSFLNQVLSSGDKIAVKNDRENITDTFY